MEVPNEAGVPLRFTRVGVAQARAWSSTSESLRRPRRLGGNGPGQSLRRLSIEPALVLPDAGIVVTYADNLISSHGLLVVAEPGFCSLVTTTGEKATALSGGHD